MTTIVTANSVGEYFAMDVVLATEQAGGEIVLELFIGTSSVSLDLIFFRSNSLRIIETKSHDNAGVRQLSQL